MRLTLRCRGTFLAAGAALLLASPPAAQAQAGAPATAAAAATLLPDALAGVTLGMTQADLLRARPGIAASGFRGDQAGHAKLLFEKVPGEFFDQVIYLFDDTQPVLASIVLSKARPPQGRTALDFRAAALKKWGMPEAAAVGRAESGATETALVWQRADGVVVASYPSDGKPGATTVRIGRRDSVADRYAKGLAPLEGSAQRKLLQEMREQLVKTPAAPLR